MDGCPELDGCLNGWVRNAKSSWNQPRLVLSDDPYAHRLVWQAGYRARPGFLLLLTVRVTILISYALFMMIRQAGNGF